MRGFILYLVIFLLVYLFYVIFVLCRKNVLKKFPKGKEMSYLKFKYGIKVKDDNLRKIANTIFLVNSFILSTTVYIVCLFDNLFVEILVGVCSLFVLILVLYHFVGTYYKNKQGGKR